MTARQLTALVILGILLMLVVVGILIRFTFWPTSRLVPPGVRFIQASIDPYEIERCPGELVGTDYDFFVVRPTIATLSIHYLPLSDVLEQQSPVPAVETFLLFYEERGLHTYQPANYIPEDLAPGDYIRHVVAQFEGSQHTSYRQLVHVVPCE